MEPSGNSKLRNFVTGLIILGAIIVIVFGLRTARAFREFRGHRPPPPFATEQVETDVSLIRDWMTVPFIGKMYHVPPRILFEALEIPEKGNHEKSLKQLNDEYYPQAKDVVIAKVKTAMLAHEPQQINSMPETPVVP